VFAPSPSSEYAIDWSISVEIWPSDMPSTVGAIAENTARAGVDAAGHAIVGLRSARILSNGTTTSASCAKPPTHNDHDKNFAVDASPVMPSGSAT